MRDHSPSLVKTALLSLLLFLGAAVTASAQLPDWSSIPVNPSSAIQFEQAWVLAQDGNKISAFSCYNRQWSTITTLSPAPTITRFNEHFIVQDGNTFWAYSPHTGNFYSLVMPSGTAVLLTTSSPQTWLTAVQDGKRVFIFFPYTGHWNAYTFATTPVVNYRNFCAVIHDGQWLYGVSAFHESLVPLPASSATIHGCYGTVAVATDPTTVYGFSAHQNTWSSTPVAAPPTITNGFAGNPGFVAVQDGTSLQFFSGASGNFVTVPVPQTASVNLHRQCAVIIDGTTVWGYSGLLGTLSAVATASLPTVTMQHYFGVVNDTGSLVAFSAATGTFSSTLAGTGFSLSTGQNIAVASIGTAPIAAYSALTNNWLPAPSLTSAQAYVGGSAAVIIGASGSGVYGMSVNQTGWVWEPLLSTADAVYQPNTPQGPAALIVVRQGNDLYAFNHATEKWRSTPTTALVTTAVGHYGAAVFTDGVAAYGFGVSNDRWSIEPLSSPPLAADVKAQVFSGYVKEGTTLHAFTGLGQVNTSNEYPDYIRNVVVGGLLRVIVSGEPFAFSYIMAAEGPADLYFPPFGTLMIDPSTAFVLAAPNLSPSGLASVMVQVPSTPTLSGVQIFLQSLVGSSPSNYYLTNATDFTIF